MAVVQEYQATNFYIAQLKHFSAILFNFSEVDFPIQDLMIIEWEFYFATSP